MLPDPFARILAFPSRRSASVSLFLALVLHTGIAAGGYSIGNGLDGFVNMLSSRIGEELAQTYEVEVEKPPEPPPPEETKEKAPAPVIKDVPRDTTPTNKEPPTPAQASQILAQEPDPNTPVDMTEAFVQGAATSYAGGTTAANGTNKNAVDSPVVSASGNPNATSAPASDLSRKPSRASKEDPNCPFPSEADSDQIDFAKVKVRIAIDANGKPSQATVTQGGDHGFGREAQRCVLRESYVPALDREGKPVASTLVINVEFSR